MADKKIPTPTPVKAIAVARPSRPGGAALATKAIPQIIITATAAPISPRHQANHQKPPGTMQAKRARAAKACARPSRGEETDLQHARRPEPAGQPAIGQSANHIGAKIDGPDSAGFRRAQHAGAGGGAKLSAGTIGV